MVRLFWFVRLVRLFSNLDGFLQSIAYMNDITLQVAVSSVFNNTAKLLLVQLLHNTPSIVSSIRLLPVIVSSVVEKLLSQFGGLSQYIIFAVLIKRGNCVTTLYYSHISK